jgi:hypothetical protein
MNAISHGPPGDTWQEPEDALGGQLPVRPRRRFLTRGSALLLALVTGAIGFYIGIRVEKGQVSSSSTGSGGLASLASRFTAARGASGSTSGRSGAASTGGLSGFAGGGFPGGGISGTVANVNGKTIYVTETGGDTVKVKLSSATKLTKSESVGRSKIDPGDRIVVSGVTGSGGTVSATSLTDSGSTSSSSTATGTGSSGTTGSSGSGVSSLFGGG